MEKRKIKKFEVKNPHAAGIDIGLSVHYVCIPEGRDKEINIKQRARKSINGMAQRS